MKLIFKLEIPFLFSFSSRYINREFLLRSQLVFNVYDHMFFAVCSRRDSVISIGQFSLDFNFYFSSQLATEEFLRLFFLSVRDLLQIEHALETAAIAARCDKKNVVGLT